jgi:Glycosyltransferase family 87
MANLGCMFAHKTQPAKYPVMNFLHKKQASFKKYPISIINICWFLLTFLTALSEIVRGPKAYNNYQIFKQVFFHTIHQTDLYATYNYEYFDSNHYGIIFSFIIAPFAILPDWLGCLLWCMANAAVLFYAIMQLPLSLKQKQIVLAISIIELLTSVHNTQFNPIMAACIMLPFIWVQQKKIWAAALMIVLGVFVKLYGIVALVTLLFTHKKWQYQGWVIIWAVVLFCLPMLYSSPLFVVESYSNWYQSLAEKNVQNTSLGIVYGQNISVHGMLQRIFNLPNLSQLWVLVPAALLNIAPLFRLKQLKNHTFQLYYLALCLISVIIFSSSAESSTYIIAVPGVAIWYILSDTKNKWNISLLVFIFLFTILSPTDLCPDYIKKHFFIQYSLKALPCMVVWMVIVFTLLKNNFALQNNLRNA